MTTQDEAKETARTLLKILSGKEHVLFTSRCNESIKLAMQIVAKQGVTQVLYQEEGGWLTYEKYIQAANLEAIKLITHDGLIFPAELNAYDMDSALLINSLAGYIALHDMDDLYGACAKNNMLLVNDVSGSIGLPEGKIGDIIVGSFGKAKPVNLGTGGFIASNDEELIQQIQETEGFAESDIPFPILIEKLKGLEARRNYLEAQAAKVKEDLKQDYQVAHVDERGLNVVVKFKNDEERDNIIEYCKDKSLEYTICPREIRILDNAISIEIKRLIEPTEDK